MYHRRKNVCTEHPTRGRSLISGGGQVTALFARMSTPWLLQIYSILQRDVRDQLMRVEDSSREESTSIYCERVAKCTDTEQVRVKTGCTVTALP